MPKKKTSPIANLGPMGPTPSTTPTPTRLDDRSVEERVYDCLRRLALVYEITKRGELDTDGIPMLDEYIGRDGEDANEMLVQTGIADLVFECLEALAPIISAPPEVTQWSPTEGVR
jgi:hypothetical protein